MLVLMIRLILERGGKQIHAKRIDSMVYVWSMLTLNIRDGCCVPFLGTIAAMEICTDLTEGVLGPLKEEIMKSLCRDYKVDIDSSSGIKP